MTDSPEITVLLVEDNDTDALLACEGLAADERASFAVTRVTSLADAIAATRSNAFAMALLDLGLPDSQGIETFARLHEQVEGLPVVVLTGLSTDLAGTETLKRGAIDFVSKQDINGNALGRAVRFALERFRLNQHHEDIRKREAVAAEMHLLEKLTDPPGNRILSAMSASGALQQRKPEQFIDVVERYEKILQRALEQRTSRINATLNSLLEALSDELGEWRAGPRDIIDIHTIALRVCLRDSTAERAQAYLEEGRLVVLNLMGHLTTFYRQHYISTQVRRSAE